MSSRISGGSLVFGLVVKLLDEEAASLAGLPSMLGFSVALGYNESGRRGYNIERV